MPPRTSPKFQEMTEVEVILEYYTKEHFYIKTEETSEQIRLPRHLARFHKPNQNSRIVKMTLPEQSAIEYNLV